MTPTGKNNTRSNRPAQRIQPRFSQRQIIWVGAGITAAVVILLVIVNHIGNTREAKANTNNDYRSVTSGSWSSTSTWQRFNGSTSSWVSATSAPTASNANVISIQSGHTVTVGSNVTADQIVVDAGGTLTVSDDLTLANGTGTDLQNNGTVTLTNRSITLNSGASISHNSGATYNHSRDGGTIPTATWNATSTCTITGVTGNMPGQINQNFGHLTWNCNSQNKDFAFNTNMSIQGNFTVAHTNSYYLALTNDNTSRTFTVGGDWIHTRGDFRGSNSGGGGTITVNGNFNLSGSTSNSWYTATSGSGVCNTIIQGNLNISGGGFWVNEDNNSTSLTVNGNFTQTNGEFTGNDDSGGSTTTINGNFSLSGPTSSCYCTLTSGSGLSTMNVNGNAAITGGNLLLTEDDNNGIFNLKGNYTHSGGFIWENSSYSSRRGEVVFNGTTQQLCDASVGASNTIHFTVKNGSWLQFATAGSFLQSAGNFTLEASARIGIRSTDGITSSGSNGHIRVSGSRSYNTGADYDYNGSALQTTGNGLPSAVRNLTINNSNGVTLTSANNPTGTLALDNGIVATGSNVLTLGSSINSTGTLSRNNGHVNGTFRRWVASAATSNILLPVGTGSSYNGFTVSFSAAPIGGLLSMVFQTGYPGNNGLPLTDDTEECSTIGAYGIWTLSGSNGFNGGTFTVSARGDGFTGINDYTLLRLIRRDNTGSAWISSGTHAPATGTAASPIVNRSGITQLGQFGITSNGTNPLPVTLTSFKAAPSGNTAVISWSTSSEKNSDYFMVQRSGDGRQFDDFRRSDAAGSSNTNKNYRVTDLNPLPGTSYYRLQQFDKDGKSEFFGPVAVNFTRNSKTGEQAISALTAGPNPFRNELTLRFESTMAGPQPLTVYNIMGAVVHRSIVDIRTGANQLSLPVAARQQSGRYLIELGEGNSVQRMQVVKL